MEHETTTNEIMDFLKDNMVTKEEFQNVEGRLLNVENSMATKEDLRSTELKLLDAMDDKLSDLKADLTVMMRKEDKKVTELISLLKEKKIIDAKEAQRLMSLQPFPQSSV